MPKIEIAAVPARKGSVYPSPFDAPCAARPVRAQGPHALSQVLTKQLGIAGPARSITQFRSTPQALRYSAK